VQPCLEVAFLDELEALRERRDALGGHLELPAVQAHAAQQPHHRAERQRVVHRGVAVHVAFERAKFVTGFSRWVKGQAQGLEPGAFKLWVNWILNLYSPYRHRELDVAEVPGAVHGAQA
jgi:hypothetical protein